MIELLQYMCLGGTNGFNKSSSRRIPTTWPSAKARGERPKRPEVKSVSH